MSNTKLCLECKETKELSEFYEDKRTKFGYSRSCKACIQKYNKTYYKLNKQKMDEYSKKYYKQNEDKLKEQHKQYAKKYYKNNRVQQLIKLREYYCKNKDRFKNYRKRNKDRINKMRREWLKRNPHKASCYSNKRRAALNKSESNYTINEWTNLCNTTGNKCLQCNKQEELTVDHIIPISKGGNNDISNIQPLCGSCNSSKGTKTLDFR